MEFTVRFEEGVWYFSVQHADDSIEEFEMLDVLEAQAAAYELVEEISAEDEGDEAGAEA